MILGRSAGPSDWGWERDCPGGAGKRQGAVGADDVSAVVNAAHQLVSAGCAPASACDDHLPSSQGGVGPRAGADGDRHHMSGGVDGDGKADRGATGGVARAGDLRGDVAPLGVASTLAVTSAYQNALEGVGGVAVAIERIGQEAVINDVGHGSHRLGGG